LHAHANGFDGRILRYLKEKAMAGGRQASLQLLATHTPRDRSACDDKIALAPVMPTARGQNGDHACSFTMASKQSVVRTCRNAIR
jgi:hypothetical protein